jgi:hypothetical protein
LPSEDGQLTETFKGNKYLQIELHWMVLTIILLFSITKVQNINEATNKFIHGQERKI